ncbi:MAG: hypothetical protein ABSF63_15050 [Candidatus Bathyarchaeia archaeon]
MTTSPSKPQVTKIRQPLADTETNFQQQMLDVLADPSGYMFQIKPYYDEKAREAPYRFFQYFEKPTPQVSDFPLSAEIGLVGPQDLGGLESESSQVSWSYGTPIGINRGGSGDLIDFVARRQVVGMIKSLRQMETTLLAQSKVIENMQRKLTAGDEGIQHQRTAYQKAVGLFHSYTGRFIAISFDGTVLGDDASELSLIDRLQEANVPPESYFIYEVGSKILGPDY